METDRCCAEESLDEEEVEEGGLRRKLGAGREPCWEVDGMGVESTDSPGLPAR